MPANLAVTPAGNKMLGYTGEVPWHGEGTRILDPMATSAQMLAASGLDWKVGLFPTFSRFTDSKGHIVEKPLKNQSIIRLDTGQVLSETALKFTPYQNKDMFAWVDAVVGEGGAVYHTAGALGDGEWVWTLVELPDSVYVGGKDEHKKFILIANAHKPGFSLKIIKTMVRVVCQNTLNQAVTGALANDVIKIAHMPNVVQRAEDAKKAFGLINQQFSAVANEFEQMTRWQADPQMRQDMFAYVWPFPKEAAKSDGSDARRQQAVASRSLAEELFSTGLGMDLFPGTLYNAVNAVTDKETHVRGKRTGPAHLAHATMGGGAEAGMRAMDFARKVLKSGY